VVEAFARIPNFVVIGRLRLGRERLAKLKTELKDFLADKDDGAAFRQATGITATSKLHYWHAVEGNGILKM
jgi:hypothetical protein